MVSGVSHTSDDQPSNWLDSKQKRYPTLNDQTYGGAFVTHGNLLLAGSVFASALPRGELRPPPGPFRLFLSHKNYRKWRMSKFILHFSPVLTFRFKQRMQRRMQKHRSDAERVLQVREVICSHLTEPARATFAELEALYVSPPQEQPEI
jgi:hypothetical protein